MGIPVVDAASEAESQCAELVKKNAVWGMASEDMDSLTFGTPFLLRHLTKSQGTKKDQSGVIEVNLATLLEDMKLTQDEVGRSNCSCSIVLYCIFGITFIIIWFSILT